MRIGKKTWRSKSKNFDAKERSSNGEIFSKCLLMGTLGLALSSIYDRELSQSEFFSVLMKKVLTSNEGSPTYTNNIVLFNSPLLE